MYINFKKLFDKSLNPRSLLLLQCIHQNKNEDNEDLIAILMDDEILETFYNNEWVITIKGKKTDSKFKKLRTSKKGRNLLLQLQKSTDWDQDDEKLADWMISNFEKRPNYVSGNKAQLKRNLHWFKFETGINKNNLAKLIECFLNDAFVFDGNGSFQEMFKEYRKENPRAVISNKPENILWTPKDRFARYQNLEDSPLWRYYQDNQKYIEKKWQ